MPVEHRDGALYVRYRDVDGAWKYKKTTARTKREAEALLRELEHAIERKNLGLAPITLNPEQWTLRALLQWWLLHIRGSNERRVTKGGHHGTLPIHPELRPHLVAAMRAPGTWVYPDSKGQQRKSAGFQPEKILRRALASAGVISHLARAAASATAPTTPPRPAARAAASSSGSRRSGDHCAFTTCGTPLHHCSSRRAQISTLCSSSFDTAIRRQPCGSTRTCSRTTCGASSSASR